MRTHSWSLLEYIFLGTLSFSKQMNEIESGVLEEIDLKFSEC